MLVSASLAGGDHSRGHQPAHVVRGSFVGEQGRTHTIVPQLFQRSALIRKMCVGSVGGCHFSAQHFNTPKPTGGFQETFLDLVVVFVKFNPLCCWAGVFALVSASENEVCRHDMN